MVINFNLKLIYAHDIFLQQMLPAGEGDFGYRHIGKIGPAELEDDSGEFCGFAHAAHGHDG